MKRAKGVPRIGSLSSEKDQAREWSSGRSFAFNILHYFDGRGTACKAQNS
jgi:hypothetical protein